MKEYTSVKFTNVDMHKDMFTWITHVDFVIKVVEDYVQAKDVHWRICEAIKHDVLLNSMLAKEDLLIYSYDATSTSIEVRKVIKIIKTYAKNLQDAAIYEKQKSRPGTKPSHQQIYHVQAEENSTEKKLDKLIEVIAAMTHNPPSNKIQNKQSCALCGGNHYHYWTDKSVAVPTYLCPIYSKANGDKSKLLPAQQQKLKDFDEKQKKRRSNRK